MAKIEFTTVNTSDATTLANFLKGDSAFYEGLQFSFGSPVKLQQSGKADSKIHHVFPAQGVTDKDGKQAYIWLSSYAPHKQKRNVNNEVVTKDGTADEAIFNILNNPANANLPLDQIVLQISQAFAGRQVRVRRKPYKGYVVFDGKTSVNDRSVLCLDFV